jgi:hypothetical protein
MKVLEAKVVDNRKEDPGSEPDHRTDTWIIEAKLETDLLDWAGSRIDVRPSEIGAEIIEATLTDAKRFVVRTRHEPKLKKGDAFQAAIREEQRA